MSFPIRGNTSVTFEWINGNLPLMINSFGIVNNGQSSVSVNVYLIKSQTQDAVRICPASLAISSGEMYEGTREIVMLAADTLRLTTTGSIGYDFTMSNIQP